MPKTKIARKLERIADNAKNNINNINDNINDSISDDSISNDIACDNNISNNCNNNVIVPTGKKVKQIDILLEMLQRPKGVTIDQIAEELKWKPASVRGVISNLQKKLKFSLMIVSTLGPAYDKEYNKCDTFVKETKYFIY